MKNRRLLSYAQVYPCSKKGSVKLKYIGNRSNIGYNRVKSITKNLPRKERSSCVILHQYTFEKIICPRCFSDHLYLYGHDKHGNQKYKCRNCNRQFSPASKQTSSQSKYPKCPLCGKATFIWHRYDTYLHFKCGSKTCNHSFKIPIPPPSLLLLPQNLDGVTSFFRFSYPAFFDLYRFVFILRCQYLYQSHQALLAPLLQLLHLPCCHPLLDKSLCSLVPNRFQALLPCFGPQF